MLFQRPFYIHDLPPTFLKWVFHLNNLGLIFLNIFFNQGSCFLVNYWYLFLIFIKLLLDNVELSQYYLTFIDSMNTFSFQFVINFHFHCLEWLFILNLSFCLPFLQLNNTLFFYLGLMGYLFAYSIHLNPHLLNNTELIFFALQTVLLFLHLFLHQDFDFK